MKKKVRKQKDQDNENEPVVVVVDDKEAAKEEEMQNVKMTPVEEEQEPMTPLAAESPMKTESKK